MLLSFHSYFLPFYSLWFSLDSFYCCVLLPNSFILQCLVSGVINPNVHSNTICFSFRSLICLFFLVFLPVYFYASLSILILGVSGSSSVNSIISVICEAALNDCFKKMCYGLHFSLLEILIIFWLDVGHH